MYLKQNVLGWFFVFQFLVVWVCENRLLVSFVVRFSISETDLYVES